MGIPSFPTPLSPPPPPPPPPLPPPPPPSRRYKVKWKGYPESEATWEPVTCLDNCPAILKRFEQKELKKESAKKAPKKKRRVR